MIKTARIKVPGKKRESIEFMQAGGGSAPDFWALSVGDKKDNDIACGTTARELARVLGTTEERALAIVVRAFKKKKIDPMSIGTVRSAVEQRWSAGAIVKLLAYEYVKRFGEHMIGK